MPPRTRAIPFHVAHLAGTEHELIRKALSGRFLAGDGPFTNAAASALSPLVGGGHCLITTSCTHALEMAALLLRLGPGDEVLMPTYTFPSMANAVALRGAIPVFIDARSDTFNLDESALESAIGDRTRAVFVMHYGGVACDMDRVGRAASRQGATVVEDNAHGLGGSWRGRPLGSFGAMATQSFHATKNAQCGEGGALVMNDLQYRDRAEIVREKGTNRCALVRGDVDRYRWLDLGSSYLLSDILAALLLAQLEHFEEIQHRRHLIWNEYEVALAGWRAEHGVERQAVPAGSAHAAHLYALLLPTQADRDMFIRHMHERDVSVAFHYLPLHSSPFGRAVGRTTEGGCPVADDIAGRLVRLPLYPDLSEDALARVIDAAVSFRPRRAR